MRAKFINERNSFERANGDKSKIKRILFGLKKGQVVCPRFSSISNPSEVSIITHVGKDWIQLLVLGYFKSDDTGQLFVEPNQGEHSFLSKTDNVYSLDGGEEAEAVRRFLDLPNIAKHITYLERRENMEVFI